MFKQINKEFSMVITTMGKKQQGEGDRESRGNHNRTLCFRALKKVSINPC